MDSFKSFYKLFIPNDVFVARSVGGSLLIKEFCGCCEVLAGEADLIKTDCAKERSEALDSTWSLTVGEGVELMVSRGEGASIPM